MGQETNTLRSSRLIKTQVSRIRTQDPVLFWPLDPGPGWVNKIKIRIRDKHPGSYSRKLTDNFWVKILKFFDADPGWIKFGSGIRNSLTKIISEPEIDAEVELDGGVHDVLGGSLHAVVQAGVDNVLLRRAGHPLVKLNTRRALVPPLLTK